MFVKGMAVFLRRLRRTGHPYVIAEQMFRRHSLCELHRGAVTTAANCERDIWKPVFTPHSQAVGRGLPSKIENQVKILSATKSATADRRRYRFKHHSSEACR